MLSNLDSSESELSGAAVFFEGKCLKVMDEYGKMIGGVLAMKIQKGTIDRLDDCRQCLNNCLLGDKYFYDADHTQNFLMESFNKNEIYIALNSVGRGIGFMRIDLFGAFAKFPLLRVIAVNDQFRGQGFGSAMLKFYEDMGFENSSKLFLLVSEFNVRAKSLYEQIGYDNVGKIPDLYQDGIAEFLMMKKK